VNHPLAGRSVATGRRSRPALVAGGGIVAMAALAGLVAAAGPTGLLTGGDSGATVRDIAASPGSLWFGVASLTLVAVLDVAVAWGLFRVFATTGLGLARLAAWSRVAYAAVFAVAIGQLADVPGAGTTAVSELADFHDVWQLALVLFGLHLVLVGRLAYSSRLVPRPVAVLVALAGLGYLIDSIGDWVVSDFSISVGAFTSVGELALGVWLVAKGAQRATRSSRSSADSDVTGQVLTPTSR
jgi:Domain of unknown function (DUF4386)